MIIDTLWLFGESIPELYECSQGFYEDNAECEEVSMGSGRGLAG